MSKHKKAKRYRVEIDVYVTDSLGDYLVDHPGVRAECTGRHPHGPLFTFTGPFGALESLIRTGWDLQLVRPEHGRDCTVADVDYGERRCIECAESYNAQEIGENDGLCARCNP